MTKKKGVIEKLRKRGVHHVKYGGRAWFSRHCGKRMHKYDSSETGRTLALVCEMCGQIHFDGRAIAYAAEVENFVPWAVDRLQRGGIVQVSYKGTVGFHPSCGGNLHQFKGDQEGGLMSAGWVTVDICAKCKSGSYMNYSYFGTIRKGITLEERS